MHLKHLLLAALAHAAIAAVAQHDATDHDQRNVDVRTNNVQCTVTITNDQAGRSCTRVLTGDEAIAWIKNNGACIENAASGAPTRCRVIATGDEERSHGHGDTRASVLRYRYHVKPRAAAGREATDPLEAPRAVAAPEAPVAPDPVFAFYPNPSNGSCTMAYALPGTGPAEIVILDPTGREVYKESVSARGPQTRTIDLSGHGPGQFIAKLVQGGVTLFKKLVIN